MVCIAAFIILCLISVFVAFLSLFRRDIGRRYWVVFRKSWHCLFQKVRLKKCDTNFKDDVKNTLLKKVVLTRPKLVKPLSVLIEAISILIVFITILSIVIAIKALLALWVFGTCNVSQPSRCSLGAEACSIDIAPPSDPFGIFVNGLSEWGEIFSAFPDRLKSWQASDYLPSTYPTIPASSSSPTALDILDIGCSACLQSYKNQKADDFFTKNPTAVLLYPIKLPDHTDKFPNSTLISRYFYALHLGYTEKKLNPPDLHLRLLDRIFTEHNEDYVNYQSYLQSLEPEKAKELLHKWFLEWGLKPHELKTLGSLADSDQVANLMAEITDIATNRLHLKSIPTLIYQNRKHQGLYHSAK